MSARFFHRALQAIPMLRTSNNRGRETNLCSSVRLARDVVSATTGKQIQARAGIRLHPALHIEWLIAAFHGVRRRLPQTTAALQLILWNVEVKASCLHI